MSNGSEHTPERCVHAVDGPDSESATYATGPIDWPLTAAMWKERAAALQARLDAMTVEWAVHWIPGDTYHDAPTEADAVSLAGEFVRSKARAVQRLVGPWTVVPEGDANV